MPDGRTIDVVLVETWRGRARLGFAAPADVKILREELLAASNAGPKKDA